MSGGNFIHVADTNSDSGNDGLIGLVLSVAIHRNDSTGDLRENLAYEPDLNKSKPPPRWVYHIRVFKIQGGMVSTSDHIITTYYGSTVTVTECIPHVLLHYVVNGDPPNGGSFDEWEGLNYVSLNTTAWDIKTSNSDEMSLAGGASLYGGNPVPDNIYLLLYPHDDRGEFNIRKAVEPRWDDIQLKSLDEYKPFDVDRQWGNCYQGEDGNNTPLSDMIAHPPLTDAVIITDPELSTFDLSDLTHLLELRKLVLFSQFTFAGNILGDILLGPSAFTKFYLLLAPALKAYPEMYAEMISARADLGRGTDPHEERRYDIESALARKARKKAHATKKAESGKGAEAGKGAAKKGGSRIYTKKRRKNKRRATKRRSKRIISYKNKSNRRRK